MTEAEFWSRVDVSGSCWEWQWGKTTAGYGVFRTNNKLVLAHRFAWSLVNGPIPGGLFVCHHCDNPSCVRPSHLFVGTQKDNMRDCVSKGRQARGERTPLAKLRAADVLSIRDAYEKGESQQALAQTYNMGRASISLIVRGKLWAHVGGPIAATGRRGNKRKLSGEQATIIRKKYAGGETRQWELASQYGVSRATISYVLNRNGVYASLSDCINTQQEG